jgi:hypothetical protein
MPRYEDDEDEDDGEELGEGFDWHHEILRAMPLAKEEWRQGKLCYRGGASEENKSLWRKPPHKRNAEPVISIAGGFRELKDGEYDVRATMLYLARQRDMVNKSGPRRCPKCGGYHDTGGQKVSEGKFRSHFSHAVRRLRKRKALIPVAIRNVKMREFRIVRIHRDYQDIGDE